MKVIVISDVHNDLEKLRQVVSMHPQMDLYLCLGDSESSNISPFTSIRGNCDYFLDYPLTKDIATPYGTMHLEHGILGNSEAYVKTKKCKIFLSGHTHRRYFKKYDDIYVFNPGSLSKPRDGYYSYLILDITENEVKFEFKSL